MNIRWSNCDGDKVGKGRKGTYRLLGSDGLWAAYFYPHGVKTPEVLVPPQTSAGKAYRAIVAHNKGGGPDAGVGASLPVGPRPIPPTQRQHREIPSGSRR